MPSSSDHSALEEFRALAEDYIEFIKSAPLYRRGEFVWQLAERLLALSAAAARLSTSPGDDFAAEATSTERADWQELYERLDALLGEVSDYRLMFDPYDSKSTPLTGSLADDAADIYRDLEEGLAVIAAGGSLESAGAEWKMSFDDHWGKHAAQALYALHTLTHPGSVKWISRDE